MLPAAALLPEGARCAGHPEVAAAWTCHRCGSFLCTACERRVRPDAVPMCPSCWELRAQKVPALTAPSGTRLQTTGLVLGALSVLPIWPLILGSLITNIVAIVKAKEPPARDVRWRPVAGLTMTILFSLMWIAFLLAVVR